MAAPDILRGGKVDPITGEWLDTPGGGGGGGAGRGSGIRPPPSFTTATFGDPLPIVYGTAKVPCRVVFFRAGATGNGWHWNGALGRWECVSDPLDGTVGTGSTTTSVKVGTIAGGSIEQRMIGMTIYFRSGSSVGLVRTITGKAPGVFIIAPALTVAPASGDLFSVGFRIDAPIGNAILAVCEAPVTSILRYWRDSYPASSEIALVSLGTTPETVVGATAGTWPAMEDTGATMAQGMTMAGTVQFRSDSLLLTDGKVPNISAEVKGIGAVTTTDANPADVLLDLATNARHGIGMSAGDVVTDLGARTIADPNGTAASSYRTYCTAMGFNVSRAVTSRGQGVELIEELLAQTNSTVIESEGTLRIIPLGDTEITANGVTYTPPSVPVAIGEHDIRDLVVVQRKPENEVFNAFSVTYQSRADDYSPVAVEFMDAAHASQYGELRGPEASGTWITTAAHAQSLAAILATRSVSVRNTLRFGLTRRWARLEPMDLISVTEAHLGLVSATYRVKSVEHDEDGSVSVEAYEWPAGAGMPVVIPTQAYDGYATSADLTPLSGSLRAQAAIDQAVSTAGHTDDMADVDILTPVEKPPVIAEVDAITGEYAGIYGSALAVRNTTERAAYDAAYDALVAHLATLTTPALWSDTDASTTIVRTTFNSAFTTYYAAKEALLTANAALASADAAAAQSTANGKAKTYTQATAPASGMAVGDLWFSTDTTTNCPDANCKGHTLDANNAPNVGTYPHRQTYWPHKYVSESGGVWKDQTVATQITAAEIVTGTITAAKIAAGTITAAEIAASTITAAKIAANSLATTNYAQDGSGNPTAGAKLDHTGTALKVAPGNLQLGALVFANLTKIRQLTVSGTSATATLTYPIIDEPDTNFTVHATVVTSSGTPPIGAYVPIQVTWSTTAIVLVVQAAPGTGNSVTFHVTQIRLP